MREHIDKNLVVEGDLRREVAMNVKRLMDLGCYGGLRHRRGLPVRGQTNAHQCTDPQGTGPGDCRQEEIGTNLDGKRQNSSAAAGTQEHFHRRRAREFELQQHQDPDCGCTGQRDCLVIGWSHGLQGITQVDAFCRPRMAAEDVCKKAQEHGVRTLEVQVQEPGGVQDANRRSAPWPPSASRSRQFGMSPRLLTTVADRQSVGECKLSGRLVRHPHDTIDLGRSPVHGSTAEQEWRQS